MLKIEDIKKARGRIRDSILVTPCARSETFSEMTGNEVFLKLENLQRTGSYKERGALNRILTLTEEERRRGLIAASAGNHAQAVSYHATRRGIPAQIVMPLATPLNKVMATRRFGAEVILHGANYDEAFDEALRRSIEQQSCADSSLRRSGRDRGTRHAGPRAARAAAGHRSGGDRDWRRRTLISGMACALKHVRPEIRVIGVETARLLR
jgi:threonine dehydratase